VHVLAVLVGRDHEGLCAGKTIRSTSGQCHSVSERVIWRNTRRNIPQHCEEATGRAFRLNNSGTREAPTYSLCTDIGALVSGNQHKSCNTLLDPPTPYTHPDTCRGTFPRSLKGRPTVVESVMIGI
jgi:hypothetical protein